MKSLKEIIAGWRDGSQTLRYEPLHYADELEQWRSQFVAALVVKLLVRQIKQDTKLPQEVRDALEDPVMRPIVLAAVTWTSEQTTAALDELIGRP